MSQSITKSLAPGQTSAPSARDLEIYKRSVILGHNQCTIALDYDLKQPRISQIIDNVRDWLAAGGDPSDPDVRDHFAQRHLSKAMQKLRIQGVIDRAIHAMEFQQPSQVTTRSRYQGTTEVWREEIRHQQPPINFPAMRLLLRAVKELKNLETDSDSGADASPAPRSTEAQLLQSVFDFLCRLRQRAEAAGHLPQSANIAQFIADGLYSLIGIAVESARRPAQFLSLPSQPDNSPAREPSPTSCPSPESLPTNTAANISAPRDLLFAPTTDQLPSSAT
jgi:hypothetical protein